MKFLIYIALITIFYSCSSGRKQVDDLGYADWYENNHSTLTKTKVLEDINVSASLVPTESLYTRNKDAETTIEDYKGMIAFKVALSNNSNVPMLKYLAEEEKTYQERIYYFTNQVKNHITLEQEGREAIYPTDVIMDRNYGISPHLTLNVLFKNSSLSKPITLHYEDMVYNLGPLNFHYNQNLINSIPTLEQIDV